VILQIALTVFVIELIVFLPFMVLKADKIIYLIEGFIEKYSAPKIPDKEYEIPDDKIKKDAEELSGERERIEEVVIESGDEGRPHNVRVKPKDEEPGEI